MSNKATPATPAAAAEPAKSGGKSRLLIIIAAAVVVLGGGGAGAYFMMHKPAAAVAADAGEGDNEASTEEGAHAKPHKKKAAKKAAAEEPGLLSLEPFTVNLADGGSHYLRLQARLILGTPPEAEKLQKNEVMVTRIRSTILELLAQQKAESLVTPEGKTELKKAIKDQVQEVLEGTEVDDVLFSDFVVQF
jgi:flagellar FliL protein